MKTCTKCNLQKERKEFYKAKKYKDGLSYWCKTCCNNYDKQDHISRRKRLRTNEYLKNEGKLVYQKNYLKYNYNLTIEQYNQMFEKQNGCCGICKKHQSEIKFRLAVDHDKDTGKVRGLLCRGCNSAIGMLKHDFQIIHNAFVYIKDLK